MPKILLAEDGLMAMNLAGVLLDDPELELDAVTDGRSALDRLAQAPKTYNLAVIAYDLPEINGPDCIRFIRQMLQRLPILVLSDTLEPDRLKALADIGIRRKYILQKPTNAATFATRVQEILSENSPQK